MFRSTFPLSIPDPSPLGHLLKLGGSFRLLR